MAQQKSTHECVQFFSHTCITGSWRTLLSCRACKKALINYVAEETLRIVPSSLYGNQLFTTNISNTAYSVSSNRIVTPEPTLRSNADEGDLRVWLHCVNTRGQRKLTVSPDTDVYHIGLTIVQLMPGSEILVQLSKSYTENARFMDLNALFCYSRRTSTPSIANNLCLYWV